LCPGITGSELTGRPSALCPVLTGRPSALCPVLTGSELTGRPLVLCPGLAGSKLKGMLVNLVPRAHKGIRGSAGPTQPVVPAGIMEAVTPTNIPPKDQLPPLSQVFQARTQHLSMQLWPG
jgi:hypothetical protein